MGGVVRQKALPTFYLYICSYSDPERPRAPLEQSLSGHGSVKITPLMTAHLTGLLILSSGFRVSLKPVSIQSFFQLGQRLSVCLSIGRKVVSSRFLPMSLIYHDHIYRYNNVRYHQVHQCEISSPDSF